MIARPFIVLAFAFCMLFLMSSTECRAQKNNTDSLYWNGQFREYIVHLPSRYDAANKYPVVLVLHGGGGNNNNTMLHTGFNKVSGKNAFIAVYPQGEKTGSNLAGKDAFHWADGRGTTPPDTAGIDHVDLLRQIIDKLSKEYSVDEKRIYACGISNGGYMAQRLACELSDKITAVASVAATFPELLRSSCRPQNNVSVLYINGTQDDTVPSESDDENEDGSLMKGYGGMVLSTQSSIDHWLELNGCNSNVQSYPLPNTNKKDGSRVIRSEYSNCDGKISILYFKIVGGGHTWPKENIHLPLTGITNKDIDASEEIWNFFSAHRR